MNHQWKINHERKFWRRSLNAILLSFSNQFSYCFVLSNYFLLTNNLVSNQIHLSSLFFSILNLHHFQIRFTHQFPSSNFHLPFSFIPHNYFSYVFLSLSSPTFSHPPSSNPLTCSSFILFLSGDLWFHGPVSPSGTLPSLPAILFFALEASTWIGWEKLRPGRGRIPLHCRLFLQLFYSTGYPRSIIIRSYVFRPVSIVRIDILTSLVNNVSFVSFLSFKVSRSILLKYHLVLWSCNSKKEMYFKCSDKKSVE